EANPDDLNKDYISMLARQGVNRLSIGVQSFFDEDLVFMNRSHTSNQAKNVIEMAQQEGISNLSVDLIFGYNLLSDEKLNANLQELIDRNVPHISCYAMTVEPRTALAHMIRTKQIQEVNPEQSARQFELVSQRLQEAGYEHYEISNYGKPGLHSVHNSNYWKGVSYLGLGPSAHSFDGVSRRWNVANNQHYIQRIGANEVTYEEEVLSRTQQVNECIMISLRLKEGIDSNKLKSLMTADEWIHFEHKCDEFILQKNIIRDNNFIQLTANGQLFADFIASELFL
ncbi:MAG TPA: coproporphyrinogen-III oxidase family protein, partial [Chitinophagaceae bacterium]|nr:coproporphyrinogen-III oxidase family protein [Chitinophagaceae bacterium]